MQKREGGSGEAEAEAGGAALNRASVAGHSGEGYPPSRQPPWVCFPSERRRGSSGAEERLRGKLFFFLRPVISRFIFFFSFRSHASFPASRAFLLAGVAQHGRVSLVGLDGTFVWILKMLVAGGTR